VKDSFYKELECMLDKFSKYHTTILLGNFRADVGKEIFSNQQLGMEVYLKLVTVWS
jgi:hypothetical protein